MGYLSIARKRMFRGKLKSFTFLGIGSFFLSGILLLLPDYYGPPLNEGISKSWFSLFFNISIGIGTSLLSASLITTIQEVDISRTAKLRALFSLNHRRKVAIVVPHFKANTLTGTFLERLADDIDTKEENKGSINEAKNCAESSNIANNHAPYIGYADFEVVKSIIALFQNHHLPIPEIITDDEANIIAGKNELLNRYGTVISVGLFSNRFSSSLNDNKKIEGQSIAAFVEFKNHEHQSTATTASKRDMNERTISFRRIVKPGTEKIDDLSPKSASICDFCVFTKSTVQNKQKEDTAIIMIGGLKAAGTIAFGKFLYESWESEISEICGRNLSDVDGQILKEENFAVLYEVQAPTQSHYSTVATIIKTPRLTRRS